jgi:acyl carrier protein
MDFDGTISQLCAIMEDVFDLDDLAITPETTAKDIKEWDSLSHIRLVVAIERRFRFKFNTAEIEGLTNVGDLAHLIEAKTA